MKNNTVFILKILLTIIVIAYGIKITAFSATAFGIGTFLQIIVIALVLGIIFAPIISEIFGNFSGRIVYSGKCLSKPLPMYGVADTALKEGRYQDALQLYKDILIEHPSELRAYAAMIEIAWKNINDENLCEDIFAQAMTAPLSDNDKNSLQRLMDDLKNTTSTVTINEKLELL